MIQIQPVFRNRDAYAALAEQEGFNYEILELSMPMAPDTDLSVLKEWYGKSGKVTGFHGVFMDVNPASGNADVTRISEMQMEESCRLAKELGASSAVFHCSCFPFLRGGYMEGWATRCAGLYDHLAEKWDLNLYIENSFDVDPDPLSVLMSKVKDPRVQVCLDIGHANYSRVPVAQWFEALGNTIGYIHLSDNMGAFDDHLPLGQGTIDWKACDAAVKALGREILMTLEVGGIDGIEQSVAFLKENHLFGY